MPQRTFRSDLLRAVVVGLVVGILVNLMRVLS